MTTIEDLDCSWINTEQKISSIDQNYIREPLEFIKLFFIYSNRDSVIEHVFKTQEYFTDISSTIITKERLLQIIQIHRNHNNKKYHLDDLISFQIDLEPENIQSFSKIDDLENISASFLKSLPIFEHIVCIPQIFIFHDIAALFFLFTEIHDSSEKNITKKSRPVREIIPDDFSSAKLTKTAKKFIRKLKRTTRKLQV